MSARLRFLPAAWALLLAALMLGPALGPGYILSYDLVWVPHLALRGDFLGFATAVPRAVPSDAMVAILDHVVPSQLLEKLALLLPLVSAGIGAGRLVGQSLVARMVAASLAVWNPFTVERLVIGHWIVLIGYGLLPWLVMAGRRARDTGRVPPVTWLLMVLGSLSATSGLVSTIALLVTAAGRRGDAREAEAGNPEAPSRRPVLALLGCALLANAPWLVAGLLHAGSATGSGAGVFALHQEGPLTAPFAALGLGGIWNADVVPASRETFLAWLGLLLLLALAGAGARCWLHWQGNDAWRLVAMWGIGYGVALLTWLLPGVTEWLAGHVPGGGLLRDGTRAFALCLPVYAGLPAAGAEVLAERVSQGDVAIRRLIACSIAVLPVLLLFDGAWGVAGRMRPVDYPSSWAVARSAVALDGGDLLVLPFSAYRRPPWNHGRVVLDPLGRFLTPDYVADDALVVSDQQIPGEDPRARQAKRALARSTPQARTRALLRLGIRYVAFERDVPASRPPRLDSRMLTHAGGLRIQRLLGTITERRPAIATVAAMGVAWAAYVAAILAGLLGLAGGLSAPARSLARRIRRDRAPHV